MLLPSPSLALSLSLALLLPGSIGAMSSASAAATATPAAPESGGDGVVETPAGGSVDSDRREVGVDPAREEGDDRAGDEGRVADEPGPTVGQRVHIIVDRRTTVRGTIELETEEVIVIRDRDELRTLPKGRVLRIVRLVEPGDGHPGIVFLNDGRVRRGTILEDGFDQVVLSIEGIRTVLPRDQVDFVELEPTFEERLEQFRDAIGPHDHIRRIELARWLISERRHEMARDELEIVVRRSELPEARHLLTLVEAQLALNERGRINGTSDDGGAGASQSLRDQSRRGIPTRLLTAEDVNVIRVYELDLDRAPRLTITPDTIDRLIEKHGASPLIPTGAGRMAMLRADPVEIARLMFQLRARDFYPEIIVHGEPHHLHVFRQRVHNAWLIPNCSTSRCHGGADGGAFFLHNDNHKDERVRYTNLMILDQTRIDGRPLIDYEDPMMSLIVQHALPRHHARMPHPDVRGWRPVLTQGNRRLLDDTINWIQSMHRPRPLYPIDYEPPILEREAATPPRQGRDRSISPGSRQGGQER